ncbi:hypothetical protein Tco_0461145 [Tanacetum coccineum]
MGVVVWAKALSSLQADVTDIVLYQKYFSVLVSMVQVILTSRRSKLHVFLPAIASISTECYKACFEVIGLLGVTSDIDRGWKKMFTSEPVSRSIIGAPSEITVVEGEPLAFSGVYAGGIRTLPELSELPDGYRDTTSFSNH